MKSDRKSILDLEHSSSILEPTKNQRSTFIKALEGYAEDFIDHLDSELSFREDSTKDRSRLAISDKINSLDEIISIFKEEVDLPGLNPASGGHLGYIPGGGIFATAMGDFMAAVSNRYAGLYFGSPGAVRLENRVIDWMKDVCQYPSSALGNLTSGGSIANLIAITSARDAKGIEGDKVSKAVIYLSEQTHHCVDKALRIAGLRSAVIRRIPLDHNFNIIPAELERIIKVDKKLGLQPFMIVASAGTTNTGNIDPLDQIADISEQYGTWFHIDAAYGGFFILLDELKAKFKGLERSDSVVMDPHKGMFLAYGLGAVLIKDQEAMLKSHHYRASYLIDASKNDQEYSPADLSPELTKHFRGLRLWLPLKLYGIEVFKDALREKRALCLYFLEQIKALGFEVGPEPDLSVGIFRFKHESIDTNTFNKELMDQIHQDGRVFLSSTLIKEEIWIRVAVLCFRTHLRTVDLCQEMIQDCMLRTEDKLKQ